MSIVLPFVKRAVTSPAVPEKSLNAIDGSAFIDKRISKAKIYYI